MHIVVDSLLTTYRRSSSDGKPALLILHGWGDSSQGWLEFGQRFEAAYDVCFVDLPGFGGTERPAVAWGLDEYAAFAGHFLAKIDVKPQVIIAHSNGGAIAVRGLADGSLSAAKLVLLASAGVRNQYKGRTKLLRLVAKTGKAVVMPLPAGVKQRLRRKLYTTVGSDMLVVENLQETFKRVVNDDVLDDAARLDLPVLLIYGQDDVSTPSRYGRLLHERLTDSTLEIIGGAEHFLHRDQPDKVYRLVEGFLGR